MALNAKPDPVRCADEWRHHPHKPPLAIALVAHYPRHSQAGWTPRCDPCVRSLAAASPDAVVVDVYDLGPARTTARYDADTPSA